jgi:hypothetical protein
LSALRPTTVTGLADPVWTFGAPPFVERHETVKLVIGDPLAAPGVNVTFSFPAPTFTTLGPVGAAGAPMMTAADGAVGGPTPRALVARTVQVYVFFVVTPVTTIGTAVAPT